MYTGGRLVFPPSHRVGGCCTQAGGQVGRVVYSPWEGSIQGRRIHYGGGVGRPAVAAGAGDGARDDSPETPPPTAAASAAGCCPSAAAAGAGAANASTRPTSSGAGESGAASVGPTLAAAQAAAAQAAAGCCGRNSGWIDGSVCCCWQGMVGVRCEREGGGAGGR